MDYEKVKETKTMYLTEQECELIEAMRKLSEEEKEAVLLKLEKRLLKKENQISED